MNLEGDPILIVGGPTASGKSALALDLALRLRGVGVFPDADTGIPQPFQLRGPAPCTVAPGCGIEYDTGSHGPSRQPSRRSVKEKDKVATPTTTDSYNPVGHIFLGLHDCLGQLSSLGQFRRNGRGKPATRPMPRATFNARCG